MLRRQSSACGPCGSVTSLAPRGVGVWGAGLLGNGAVELLPDPEPEKYGHETIARGGSVRVPAARVVPGRGPAVSPTNPGLQGARVVEINRAGTLQPDRLGFGRSRGGIRVPVAQVAVDPEALAARFALEGKMDRPASAIPITVDQAVEVLKAAESGFQGTDAEYANLVADAQRLKLLRAATARRPLSGEERAVMEAIAKKYGAVVEGAVADSTRSQRILDSSEARAQRVVSRGDRPSRIRSARSFADRVRSQLSARFAGHDREQARLAASIAAAMGPSLTDIKGAVDTMAAEAGASAGDILRELAATRASSSAEALAAKADLDNVAQGFGTSANEVVALLSQMPSMAQFGAMMNSIGSSLGVNTLEVNALKDATERFMGALVGQTVRIHPTNPDNSGRLGASSIPGVLAALGSDTSGSSVNIILPP